MGLVLSGDFFYRLSAVTPFICSLGCLAFSAGAFPFNSVHRAGRFRGWRSRPVLEDKLTLRTIDFVFVACVAFYPSYWHMLTVIGQKSPAFNMLHAVRIEMVQGDIGKSVGLGFYNYFIEFLRVMTLIVATETCRLRLSKWRLILWITLLLAFCVPTGSRLGSLVALAGVLAIFTFVKNRIPLLPTCLVIATFLGVFSLAAIVLEKGGSLDASPSENIGGVARSFQVYALGGIVACDQLLQSPPEYPEEAHSLHFFYAVAAALGLHTKAPGIVDLEVLIPWRINVYSVYYYYLEDLGWIGMCAAFFVLGSVLAGLHRAAAMGRPEAITLLGLGCSYLVFPCAGDPFILGLSSCIQSTALVLIIYNVAPLLRLFKLASATPPTLGGGQNRVFRGNIARHYHCELEHQGGASRMSSVDRSGPPGGDRSTTSGRGG